MPTGRLRALIGALCALFLLCPSNPLHAAPPLPGRVLLEKRTEYELKAAFLYNFAKYTSWPEGAHKRADSPLVIAVIGKDRFGPVLDAVLKGKKIGGRPILLKRISKLTELEGVHVVYVGDMSKKIRGELLATLRKKAVLTVGGETSFIIEGGICRFYLEKSKLRFEVNVDAASRANLDMSSQLLKLAKIVKDKK